MIPFNEWIDKDRFIVLGLSRWQPYLRQLTDLIYLLSFIKDKFSNNTIHKVDRIFIFNPNMI